VGKLKLTKKLLTTLIIAIILCSCFVVLAQYKVQENLYVIKGLQYRVSVLEEKVEALTKTVHNALVDIYSKLEYLGSELKMLKLEVQNIGSFIGFLLLLVTVLVPIGIGALGFLITKFSWDSVYDMQAIHLAKHHGDVSTALKLINDEYKLHRRILLIVLIVTLAILLAIILVV